MPAPGQSNPEGLPERCRQWLRSNPGEHRARDVAEGLGVPDGMTRAVWSQKVANALNRMVTGQGRGAGGVMRRHHIPAGYKKPVGLYAAAPQPASADQ